MPSVIQHAKIGSIGSTTDQGNTLGKLPSSNVRSRANGCNKSSPANDVAEKGLQDDVESFFMYRKSKAKHRNIDRRHLGACKPESNSPNLESKREIVRKRQKEVESETDSEESQDDEDDWDNDGDNTSEDEGKEEEEKQPKPTTSSGGILLGGGSPTHTVGPEASSRATLGSEAIIPLPSKGGFARNPAHIAVLITGIVVAAIIIIFFATCMIIRSKRRQKPGGLYNRYQGLRRNLGFASQDTLVNADYKTLHMEKNIMNKDGIPDWDPASGFAKPSEPPLKSKLRNSQEKHSSILRKVLTGKKSSIPHINARPKSLVLRVRNSAFGLPKVVPAYEEIQPLTKAHTVDSNRSSLLAQGHENGNTHNILPPVFTSKFSWTNTPSTNTYTNSAMLTPKHLHSAPRAEDNDAATVFTEDTEPPRFKTTTSWVLQQQVKNQHQTHSNPDIPKPPPSDIDSSISEDSRVPDGALPGLAI
ncbi:hypothetical protein I7I51_08513 [Histoplasma capsulatum]|uniref:Uncharacterized protein n=1 Tax=Ajellomyces capsulatus TaxID=5037 RepID=A0A8A1LZA9_AJECA|nr:hypothetical protein I7I51_08513 [Histoplasma capsulatum]